MKSTKTPAPPAPPKPPAPSEPAKDRGTQRWPANAVVEGEWFQLPKVLTRRFPELGIEAHHLLLLLVLQTDRYRDRPHRYYWEELAALCGCTKNTVRRWGYELKKKGLLRIIPVRTRLPGEERRVGHRNARSIFDLAPLEEKVEQMQAAWLKERPAKEQGGEKTKRSRPAA